MSDTPTPSYQIIEAGFISALSTLERFYELNELLTEHYGALLAEFEDELDPDKLQGARDWLLAIKQVEHTMSELLPSLHEALLGGRMLQERGH